MTRVLTYGSVQRDRYFVMPEQPATTGRPPVEIALSGGFGVALGLAFVWWMLLTNEFYWPDETWQQIVLIGGAGVALASIGMTTDATSDAFKARAEQAQDFTIAAAVSALCVAGIAVTVIASFVAGPTLADVDAVETSIEQELDEQGYPADVDCGDRLPIEAGTTSDCFAEFDDGSAGRVEVRWRGDGGFLWEVVG